MSSQFKFKRDDKIGASSAEDDKKYLEHCFVDCGDVGELTNSENIKQIIVGRTGSGKSAILWKIKEKHPQNSISLSPDNLALTYVANSDIIIYYSQLGINLTPFFKLLWRHILTVEVLKKYVENHPNVKKDSFIDTIVECLKGKKSERKKEKETLEYLKRWGEKFWLETEYRVKEITLKLEESFKDELKASGNYGVAKGGFSFEEFSKLAEEKKIDVKNKAQKIVSSAQVQDLARVIELLNEVLDNRQQVYYVLIDGLDESWIEDELRYKLIMALIVTIKDLNQVRNQKTIIAMRRDLIDRVFRVCRTTGFQEEKYRDYYATLRWNKDFLAELLDKRINHLIRDRYQKNRELTHLDLLPTKINRCASTDYILSRVSRPRDVIAFFNTCIAESVGDSKFTSKTLKLAEGEYSRGRLRALADEWQADYPRLLDVVGLLNKRKSRFKVGSITNDEISDFCLRLSISWNNEVKGGDLESLVSSFADGQIELDDFKREFVCIFYMVGIIGLKLESFESYSWSDESGRGVSISEIVDDTGIEIHPIYRRTLGVF